MAKAIVKHSKPAPPPVEEVTLDLTPGEAEFLYALLWRSCCGRLSGKRKFADTIGGALMEAGVRSTYKWPTLFDLDDEVNT